MNRDPSITATTDASAPADRPALVVLWSRDEPERVGEVALLGTDGGPTWVLGRDATGEDRLSFRRQRPGGDEDTGQLRGSRISRDHLQLSVDEGRVGLRNVGRVPVRVNDRPGPEAVLADGDTIEIERELLLLVTRRPIELGAASGELGPFGEPDEDGIVGESPVIWALRRRMASSAAARDHVLVHGPAGSGRELVAHGIHRQSRTGRPLVSRDATTFPEGLGEADGSTLFLDELGELSPANQAHLLRVLAAPSRFRLIGATHRPPEALDPDLVARLSSRVDVPGLGERREDIPFLARRVLSQIASEKPDLFPAAVPQPHPRLLAALVRHPYTTHVRELRQLLWRALDEWSTYRGPTLRALHDTAQASSEGPG